MISKEQKEIYDYLDNHLDQRSMDFINGLLQENRELWDRRERLTSGMINLLLELEMARELLRRAVGGIQWNIEQFPENQDEADHEFITEIKLFLSGGEDEIGSPI